MSRAEGFEEALIEYIRSEVKPNIDRVDTSTDLVSGEGIDSLGMLAIVGFVEEWYGIEIEAEDVSVEHFRTVRTIRDFALGKLSP